MSNTQRRPDTDLKRSIIEELEWTPNVDPTHIGVAVNAGRVTLSGEVSSYPEKIEAEKAAMRVFGVTGIAEEVTVRSAFGPGNDADMARDAVQAIERMADVPAGSVKVEVHHNVVTLCGSVPWNYQRELAARAVRHLKGVINVINVVSIRPTASAVNIKDAITAALVRNAVVDAEHSTVTADAAGLVTLAGSVQSWTARQHAERAAWAAPGVTAVDNKLHIRN